MVDTTGMVPLKGLSWLSFQLSATPAFLPYGWFIQHGPYDCVEIYWHAH
jgi:hypothetical protein